DYNVSVASAGVYTFQFRVANSYPVYSVTGGVAFFMNRHVSFDMALAYTGGDIGAINSYLGGTTNALTPNIPKALNFSLGFQVYFGKN
ncbi:hypothetical protein, partial [Spirosoma migulaei]